MHATNDRPRTVSNKLLAAISGCLVLPLLLFLTLLLLLQNTAARAQTSVIYVDVGASGAGDGSTWADAFTYLQDALAAAGSGGEIWVAGGVYTPGVASSDHFNLPSGVALYGGFAGDETERDQRDWEVNPTVLSGDIGGDDVTDSHGVVTNTANIVGVNANHVLMLNGTSTPITASTRLDGVIVTAGQANVGGFDAFGAGLHCNGGGAGSECSPTVANVTFAGNRAESSGGAMYTFGHIGISSPTLTNVTFSGNSASFGGAMFNSGSVDGASTPTLTNVIFAGNWAENEGGAMYNYSEAQGVSSPTLINVIFAGNQAGSNGGAIYNAGFNGVTSPTLTNVTFAGNAAAGIGGAMDSDGTYGESSPTLTNVIFWENSAGVAGDVLANVNTTVTISHSLVQGGWNGSGIYNISGSVADGGGNIDGDPRFVSPIDPNDAPTTAGDLRLPDGSPAIDAGDDDALPPGVGTDLAGNPRIQGNAVDMGAYESLFHFFVDADATGAASGASWTDAFTDVQDALTLAHPGSEIWVAQGLYTPGVARGDSFNLPSGVALYGGFAGDETQRDQRDWVSNPTVLSGDIGGDDVTGGRGVVTDTANIIGNNAFHVLELDGTTTPITGSTRLDGVVVTAGQANGPLSGSNSEGGGLYCDGGGATAVCSPTLSNVTFSGNWAVADGGAMFNNGWNTGRSSPTLTNVTFSGNAAGRDGGAMFNDGHGSGDSRPTLTDVTFTANVAADDGGAVYNEGLSDGQSSPTLTNVTFAGNLAASQGGAMYNDGRGDGVSSPTLTNVIFTSNAATTHGGAMANEGSGGDSSPTLTNVTFAGNAAGERGGAMVNSGSFGVSTPILANVILWQNSAGASGDVMYNDDATVTIAHSLVQGGLNGSGIVNVDSSSVTDGGGNIDADPLFAGPVDPADAPTTAGNLRLLPGSPAIDAGDNDALPAGLSTDLDGNARLYDGDNDGAAVVDMGAYEFTLPLINVSLAPQSVLEDSGQALTVTVTRTRNTLGELTVAFGIGGSATFEDDYTQSGASSFDDSSGTLTFGDGAVTHTLLLTPAADSVVEVDETIIISLTTTTLYQVEPQTVLSATIMDDDVPGVLVSPTTGLTTTEAGGIDTFTVVLQSAPAGEVTVALSSDDAGEGVASPAALTFDAGNWQTPQTVTVGGVDDDEIDGDVGYNILLTVSSDDPVYDGIAAGGVGVTNMDDEALLTYHYYLPGPFGHQATAP